MVNATGKDQQWDKEADVIVVGFGAAGGISAITAHDIGAKVLLIEKMPHPGGISMLSGGGACCVGRKPKRPNPEAAAWPSHTMLRAPFNT